MRTRLSSLFNRTRINLILDLLLTLAFAVELEFRFTGLRIHELLGLAFGLALLLHVLLHLDWIWSITRTFFRLLLHESHLNYLLNALLLLDAVVLVITGLFISRTLGLTFNVGQVVGLSWERMHILAAGLSLVLIALHVAMHWKWLATTLTAAVRGRTRRQRRAQGAPSRWGGITAGAVIFVLVVVQMGVAMRASRYMKDPFDVFQQIARLNLSTLYFRGYQGTQPLVQMASGGVRFDWGGLNNLNWREFGHVVFDWWFIAAVTAVILIIGRPVGLIIKTLRPQRGKRLKND